MVDKESEDLNMFAELPEDEKGYTDYFFERPPDVTISNRLSEPRYENRCRFTLWRGRTRARWQECVADCTIFATRSSHG